MSQNLPKDISAHMHTYVHSHTHILTHKHTHTPPYDLLCPNSTSECLVSPSVGVQVAILIPAEVWLSIDLAVRRNIAVVVGLMSIRVPVVSIHGGAGGWWRCLAGVGRPVTGGGAWGRRKFLVEGGWPGVHHFFFRSPSEENNTNHECVSKVLKLLWNSKHI